MRRMKKKRQNCIQILMSNYGIHQTVLNYSVDDSREWKDEKFDGESILISIGSHTSSMTVSSFWDMI